MSTFVEDMVSSSELLLANAREDLAACKYADAASWAESALDGFLFAKSEHYSTERVSRGIETARRLMETATRLWKESGQSPTMEEMDRLKAGVSKDVRAFIGSLDQAVRAPAEHEVLE